MINVVVLAIGYPAYLYFLGYEKYGVWLILVTLLNFAQVCSLSTSQAVTKLVAEEYGRKNTESIEQYVTTAMTIFLVSGFIVLSIICIFKSQVISIFKLSDENTAIAVKLLPYVGMLSIYAFVSQILNATLSGFGRLDIANYAQASGKIIATGVAVLLLYTGKGVESILIGNSVGYIFIHVISLMYIKRSGVFRFVRSSNICLIKAKRLLSFGSQLFGSSMVTMFLMPFNKLIISRYIGVSSVPIYEIAFKGAMQIQGLFSVGLGAIMPEISRLASTASGMCQIKNINRQITKFIALGGSTFFFLILCFAGVLLRIWLRERFSETLLYSFRIIIASSLFCSFAIPAYYTIIGLGNVKYVFISHLIQSSVNVICVFMLLFLGVPLSIIKISAISAIALMVGALLLLWGRKRSMSKFVARNIEINN